MKKTLETCNRPPVTQVCTLVQGLDMGQVCTIYLVKWSEGKEKARLQEEMVAGHAVSAAPGARPCVNCPEGRSELFMLPVLPVPLATNAEREEPTWAPGPSCQGCWESKPLPLQLPHGWRTLLPTKSHKKENFPSTERAGWEGPRRMTAIG